MPKCCAQRAPAVQTLNSAVARRRILTSHRTAAQIAALQWTCVTASIDAAESVSQAKATCSIRG